jgi:hypothetical protein
MMDTSLRDAAASSAEGALERADTPNTFVRNESTRLRSDAVESISAARRLLASASAAANAAADAGLSPEEVRASSGREPSKSLAPR